MGKGQVIAQYVGTGTVAIGLGIAFLVVYGLYGQQPCKTQLPVWVLVSGISLIVGFLVTLFGIKESLANADLPYSERVSKRPETTGGKAANALGSIINLFNFVWFIVGNVWTFSISSAVCQYTLYTFCYWVIIVQWILVCLTCCGICIVLIVICGCKK